MRIYDAHDITSRLYRPVVETITEATQPALPLADVRSHLGVTQSDDDALIQSLMEAAVAHASQVLGYPLMACTRRAWFDADALASCVLRLSEPASAIVDVVAFDTDGNATTLTDTTSDVVSLPARVFLDTIPDTRTYRAVAVEYETGWTPHTLPASIRHALLLMIGLWYMDRADTSERSRAAIPLGVDALLFRHRLNLGVL